MRDSGIPFPVPMPVPALSSVSFMVLRPLSIFSFSGFHGSLATTEIPAFWGAENKSGPTAVDICSGSE